MLPILRVLPVGGVLLAILILVLALAPPEGPTRVRSPDIIAARGSLIDRNEHPEWRQFLIQAALRRADELSRLLLLPDTPARKPPFEAKATIETKTIVLPAQEPAPKVQQKEPEQNVAARSATPTTAEPDQSSRLPLPSDTPARNAAVETKETIETKAIVLPAEEPAPRLQQQEPEAKVAGLPATLSASAPSELSRPPLLPDTPAGNAPVETKATIDTKTIVLPEPAPKVQQKEPEQNVAGLPATRSASEPDPDPDEITSSIEAPTIPVEIGATSSSELPVVLPPERPPVMRKPISVNPGAAKKVKRAKATAKPATKPAAEPAAAPERELNWLEKLVYGNKAGTAQRAAKGSPADRPFQPPQVRTSAH